MQTESTPDRSLRERLEALAAFRPVFERDGFRFAEMVPGTTEGGMIRLGGSVLGPDALRFCRAAYDHGWVRPLDWATWRDTADGQRLMRDPAALATASPDDLVHVLTTCLRADRFCEGYLSAAFDAGLVTRVVVRAAALLANR